MWSTFQIFLRSYLMGDIWEVWPSDPRKKLQKPWISELSHCGRKSLDRQKDNLNLLWNLSYNGELSEKQWRKRDSLFFHLYLCPCPKKRKKIVEEMSFLLKVSVTTSKGFLVHFFLFITAGHVYDFSLYFSSNDLANSFGEKKKKQKKKGLFINISSSFSLFIFVF